MIYLLKRILGYIPKKAREAQVNFLLPQSPSDLKKRAQELIEDAKYYADEINKSTSIFDFTYSYQEFVKATEELIYLNEQKHISMYPTPRDELENAKAKIGATVNDFIARTLLEIRKSGAGQDAIIVLLDEIEKDEYLAKLMADNNRQRIEQLRKSVMTGKSLDALVGTIALDEDAHRAVEIIFETGQASVSMLERRGKWSYSKAAKIVDSLEEAGIVGPFEGTRPRLILISRQEYERRVKVVPSAPEAAVATIDLNQIIQEENDWRRQQRGLSPIESEMEKVDNMDGHAFENWCAELLKQTGFTEVEVTPGSGDQGVDILAVKEGVYYAIQCKCYSSDLDNTPIQEVYAGKEMYNCQVGAVMTNRHFTEGARKLAEKTRVLLWDRNKLIELLEQAK